MRYRFLRFPSGKPKAVTLSYDDGVRQDLKLVEMIDRYGIKATFNLTDLAGEDENTNRLSKDEVCKYILEKGHEVAVHGRNHRAEGGLRCIEGIHDILSCRLELENALGCIIRGMAYPGTGITRFYNGADYNQIKAYLSELDIAYSRSLGGDNNMFKLPTDWHCWMPTAHHNHPEVLSYAGEFVGIDYHSERLFGAERYPRLFYLWGHSHELDYDNNWGHFENILHLLSAKEDVWYATNIEIYTYVTAYQSLIYSADSTRIFNPTIYDIWMEIDGKLYVAKSGEYIMLT